MSEEPTRLLAAQAAIRAGNKQQARQLLQEELAKNPHNFRAWLWLAGLAEGAEESLHYVQEAERLNPTDPGVLKARAWAEQRLAQQQKPLQAAATEEIVPAQDRSIDNLEVEGTVARRVDELREQQIAGGDTPLRPRRRLVYAAIALIVVMLLSALLWRWDSTASGVGNGAPSEGAVTATTDLTASGRATPTAATNTEPDTIEISFVSGQFAPQKNDGAPDGKQTDDGLQSESTATPQAFQAKPVNKTTSSNPRATWTLTPSPTFTPTATPTPIPTFVSEEQVVVGGATRPDGVGPSERWIDVNLTTQRLVAYEGDRAVFNSLISSGTWLHPTVTGQFRVWLRYTAQTMDGRRLGYDYYLPNVPYVMYFYRDYALHGTYWHNNFGTPMSHGCVNLPTPAAEWIFNWSSIGTLVSVHY